MNLWCLFGSLCLSAEAWAGWTQALGAVAAIAGTAWAVQRAHRLQLLADRAREMRLLALDTEAFAGLLGEVLVRIRVAEAAAVDDVTLQHHLAYEGGSDALDEVAEMLELVRPAMAAKPQWGLQFVRALRAWNAAREALRHVPLLGMSSETKKALAAAANDVDDVIRLMQDHQEIYFSLAEDPRQI